MKKDVVDQINDHLSAIAELTRDPLTIQIGFGENGNSGGTKGMDFKIVGSNPHAAHLGEKLVSLIAPVIENFIKNEFSAWKKAEGNKDISEWEKGHEQDGNLTRFRRSSGGGFEKKSRKKGQMPYIDPNKARA